MNALLRQHVRLGQSHGYPRCCIRWFVGTWKIRHGYDVPAPNDRKLALFMLVEVFRGEVLRRIALGDNPVGMNPCCKHFVLAVFCGWRPNGPGSAALRRT